MTDESIKTLDKAIKSAESILKSKNETDTEVFESIIALEQAIKELVKFDKFYTL